MTKPLCFVLMPFGEKTDPSGIKINFDAIYGEMIHPAIEHAGLEPIRADEEKAGGMIQRAMFERFILCEYAVVDLTAADAEVFYQLGIRHGVRPYKTILIFNAKMQLPFDLNMMHALPYRLDNNGRLADRDTDIENLKKKLGQIKAGTYMDSALFQVFDELPPPTPGHEKTDIFRDGVLYSPQMKEKLKKAREQGKEAVREVEKEPGEISSVESGILIDLLLSYRATKAWDEMIELVQKMPKPLAERVMVQEQLGFALNRAGDTEKAEKVLTAIIENHGPGSETCGILGRVYKDRWERAKKEGDEFIAEEYLEKAIETYIKGFEADWRDSYPGVNAVTLLELSDPDDPRKEELLPVVTYAVKRKIAGGKADYWDYATLLELSVLAGNREGAREYSGKSLIAVRETWEPETTARNLRLIREAGEKRNKDTAWIKKIEEELLKKT
jgi:tetratricopeptide (TPR) repeat protein